MVTVSVRGTKLGYVYIHIYICMSCIHIHINMYAHMHVYVFPYFLIEMQYHASQIYTSK